MKLNKLISKITLDNYSFLIKNNIEMSIYECRLLSDNTLDRYETFKSLDENILYICEEKELENVENLKKSNILILSHERDLSSFSSEKIRKNFSTCNIAFSQSLYTRDYILNNCIDLLIRETKLSENINTLLSISNKNLGLEALTDAAYGMLKNPIIIVDNDYKILASCHDAVKDRPDLEMQKSYGYLLDSNIEDIKKAKLYEKARMYKYPVYNKASFATEGWITALIYVYGIEIGHIAVSDSNFPFKDEDFELIDFLSKLISLEMQKSDFFQVNDSMMHSFFLGELLDGEIRDGATALRRLQSLKWTLDENLRIMTIFQEKNEILDKKARLISQQIQEMFPHSHYTLYEGHTVFLISSKTPDLADFKNNTKLSSYLQVNELCASVSRSFKYLTEVRDFYKESITAYSIGKKLDTDKTIYLYTDYLCHHIGEIIYEKYNLTHFIHPAIGQINNYDKKHKSSLLSTLREYLTYPDNPSLVAKKLFIHKNTLFYRLGKIKEIFSLDLSDGEQRLILHMSIKFMEYNGDL